MATSLDMLRIAFVPANKADDAPLVAYLTSMLNASFAEAQVGMFCDSHNRTNSAEVASLIRAQALAVAFLSDEDTVMSCDSIKGCAKISMLSPAMGTLGLLCTVPRARQTGIGKQLVFFAEAHCLQLGATSMQLDILVPRDHNMPLKIWLQAWYEQFGYVFVDEVDALMRYPQLAQNCLTPLVFRIFEKRLDRIIDEPIPN